MASAEQRAGVERLFNARAQRKLSIDQFMKGVVESGNDLLVTWRGTIVRVNSAGEFSAAYQAHRAKFNKLSQRYL